MVEWIKVNWKGMLISAAVGAGIGFILGATIGGAIVKAVLS